MLVLQLHLTHNGKQSLNGNVFSFLLKELVKYGCDLEYVGLYMQVQCNKHAGTDKRQKASVCR